MAKTKLKPFLLKWHKKLGIFSAFFVVLLSITGILLNHSSSLKLGGIPVTSSWLLKLYGVDSVEVKSVEVNGNWFSQSGSQMYMGAKTIVGCSESLVGAISLGEYYVLACERTLLIMSDEFELLDKVTESFGLPVPVEKVGECEGKVCVDVAQKVMSADIETLDWKTEPVNRLADSEWSQLNKAPVDIHENIAAAAHGANISVERVVQDIHAGRFFGSLGPLFMDLVAVIFILIAASGSFLWLKKRR